VAHDLRFRALAAIQVNSATARLGSGPNPDSSPRDQPMCLGVSKARRSSPQSSGSWSARSSLVRSERRIVKPRQNDPAVATPANQVPNASTPLVNDQASSPPRCRMPCLDSSIANLAAASSGVAAVVTIGLLDAIHASSNEVRTLPTGNLRSK
jgi:hypothetical protein